MLLSKDDNSNSSGMKFLVNCQEKLKGDGTTKGWLEDIQKLVVLDNSKDNMSDRVILQGLLDKKKTVVLKIGRVTDTLIKELENAKKLHDANVSGILNYYCYFEYMNKTKLNTKPIVYPSICNGEGDAMKILVMEHIPNWNFKLFKWTESNIPLLKSCCKQFVCTLLDAYLKTKFVHKDTNLQNVLLKKTSSKSISYNFEGQNITIDTEGYYTILMDFELSEFYTDNSELRRFFIDIRRFFDYLDNELIIEIRNTIETRELFIKIMKEVDKFDGPINIKATDILQIIPLIDNIEYRCNRSNIKKSNISYREFVYGGNRK